MSEKTPVLFRKWKTPEGDIIAVFPTLPGKYTRDPDTCLMYEHVGQHGSGSITRVMKSTKAASPDEYAQLKRELEGRGYELQVVYRSSARHRAIRTEESRRP